MDSLSPYEKMEKNRLDASRILSRLAAQQKEGTLCDVILEAEGKQLQAHRAVLAAASPYFHAMFTSGFKEKHDKVIILHDVSYEGLSAVIHFVYNLELEVLDTTVGDILGAACLLQIPMIVDKCESHLVGNITKSSWSEF